VVFETADPQRLFGAFERLVLHAVLSRRLFEGSAGLWQPTGELCFEPAEGLQKGAGVGAASVPCNDFRREPGDPVPGKEPLGPAKHQRSALALNIGFGLADQGFGVVGGVFFDKEGGAGCGNEVDRPQAPVDRLPPALAGLRRVAHTERGHIVAFQDLREGLEHRACFVRAVHINIAQKRLDGVNHHKGIGLACEGGV
jgi:hypothetical protein